jgi:hypothetical protein
MISEYDAKNMTSKNKNAQMELNQDKKVILNICQ